MERERTFFWTWTPPWQEMNRAAFSLRSPCTQQPQSCGSFKEVPCRVIDSLLRNNDGDKSPSGSQHHRVLHVAVFQRLPYPLQWDNVTSLKRNNEVEKESEIMKLCVSYSAPLILRLSLLVEKIKMFNQVLRPKEFRTHNLTMSFAELW